MSPDPRLLPADAVVALRSFPRRFGAVLARAGDPDDVDPDDLASRNGPDGASALDHTAHAARTIALLDRALEQLLVDDQGVLHPAVTDRSARDWSGSPPTSVNDALAELTAAAGAMAERAAGVANADWDRSAPVAGGAAVNALDLVRDAVATGAASLGATEATLSAVR